MHWGFVEYIMYFAFFVKKNCHVVALGQPQMLCFLLSCKMANLTESYAHIFKKKKIDQALGQEFCITAKKRKVTPCDY